MLPLDHAFSDTTADQRRRARMVRDQLDECADLAVKTALSELPRHAFVPADLRVRAYEDAPLPIGVGQTISQPRVVALMLSALALRPGARVLDVGCGSGYAAALLARLVEPTGRVVAIERQGPLVPATRARLRELAPMVELRLADGLAGAPDAAPFDAIHIACACAEMPTALIAQLALGGRMVLPVGAANGEQRLVLLTKSAAGVLSEQPLAAVYFVPALSSIADDPNGDPEIT